MTEFLTTIKLLAISSLAGVLSLFGVQSLGAWQSASVQQGSTPVNGDVLQTNGTTSTWVATSTLGISSNPAGSNTQIQFNNNGSFGASSNLNWDGNKFTTTNASTTDLSVANIANFSSFNATSTIATSTISGMFQTGTTTLTGQLLLGNIANPIIQQYDNGAWGTNTKKLTLQAGSPTNADTITFDAKGSGETDYQTIISNEASLVSYWKMDNDWLDSEGTNHGTATGATFGTAKYGTYSGSFDGTDDYVNVPDAPSLNFGTGDLTVEAWIKSPTGSVARCIMSKDDGLGTAQVNLYLNASGILMGHTGGSGTISTAMDIDDDFWHQVVMTRNSGTVKIYVDGVEKVSGVGTGNTDTTRSLLIGAYKDSIGTIEQFFNGLIDEVAVYNTALSATKISEHYLSSSNVPRTKIHFKNSGLTNTGADTYIDGDIYAGSGNTKIQLTPSVADSATAVAHTLDTENALSTAGSKLLSLKNNGTEKAYISKDGGLVANGDSWFETSGSGLPYGHMYSNTSTTITVSVSDTWYEVDTGATDFTAGELNNVTFTDHYLTVSKAGRYLINYSMALETASANQELAGTIAINGTASETAHGHNTVVAANQSSSLSGTTILNLVANDQISLAVKNHTLSTNIVVEHAQLSVVQIGG